MITTPMIAVVVVLPLLCVVFYKLQMLRALCLGHRLSKFVLTVQVHL